MTPKPRHGLKMMGDAHGLCRPVGQEGDMASARSGMDLSVAAWSASGRRSLIVIEDFGHGPGVVASELGCTIAVGRPINIFPLF
jgi:hypothetical protein